MYKSGKSPSKIYSQILIQIKRRKYESGSILLRKQRCRQVFNETSNFGVPTPCQLHGLHVVVMEMKVGLRLSYTILAR